MNVLEMIKDRLRLLGADGLCREGCGCGIGDLIPCESDPAFCVPAKGRQMLPEEEDYGAVRFGIFYEPLSLPNPQDQRAGHPAPMHPVVGRIQYSKEDLEKYWAAKCPKCDWRGLSRDCEGGQPIADTGDFSDLICPKCFKDGHGSAVFVEDDDPPNPEDHGAPPAPVHPVVGQLPELEQGHV